MNERLDQRVAETVMGQKVVDDPRCWREVSILKDEGELGDLPEYSTKIEWAMKVFDRMREKGHRWLLNADDAGFHLRHVAYVTHHGDIEEKDYRVDRPLGTAKKLSDLPRVICEAALREIGVPAER